VERAEKLRKLNAGAAKTALDGAFGYSEEVSGLLVVVLIEQAEADGVASDGGERLYGVVHAGATLERDEAVFL
jgi:hypothetical protein